MSALYQYRDQTLKFTVFEEDGTTVSPASGYSNAEYRVYPVGSCTPVLSKSLGSGITVSGDDFVVTIADDEITFSGTDGEYKHVFTVGVSAGELLPSIVDSVVDVIPGCQIT